MTLTPMSVASMALQFATMVCFGIHKEPMPGEKGNIFRANAIQATAFLGLASFVLDLIMGASGGNRSRPMVGVTEGELRADLENLRQELDHDFFELFVNDKLSTIHPMEKAYRSMWDDLEKDVKSRTGDPIVDDELNKGWADYYGQFDGEIHQQSKCLSVLDFLSSYDEYKLETLSVYMLTAGLFLNICQMLLLKEFIDIQNDAMRAGDHYADLHHKWKKVDMPAYKAELAKWQAGKDAHDAAARGVGETMFDPPSLSRSGGHSFYWGPVPGKSYSVPEPKQPTPPPLPPQFYTQLQTSVAAKAIRDNIGDFIDYAEPILNDHVATNAAYKAALKDATSQIDETVFSDSIRWKDGYIPTQEPVEANPALAKDQITLQIGMAKAGLLPIKPAKLAVLDDDTVADLQKTIVEWKRIKDQYALED
jgi:hypothetical protein